MITTSLTLVTAAFTIAQPVNITNMVGEDITLPVQVMEVGEYTIDIQKDAAHYVATFCVE